jgi:uncharacterized protein (UPF0261 family)
MSVGALPRMDPDAALVEALRDELDARIERHEVDTDVNDPAFARALADRFDALCRAGRPA